MDFSHFSSSCRCGTIRDLRIKTRIAITRYLTIPTPRQGCGALIRVWIMILIFMVISHRFTKAPDQEGGFNIYWHWSLGTVISINGRSISHMGWLKSPETCYLCGRLYELRNWMYIACCCRRIPRSASAEPLLADSVPWELHSTQTEDDG